LSDLLRALHVDIEHAGEFHLGNVGKHLCVQRTQVPDADNAEKQVVAHCH
jgi:hypothetical protein